jgi:UDP-N-acetyl-D-galactosamine dehydrogenase
LLLGFTFKEDCPDVRNTRVIDIYNELISYEINVEVYDPWASTVDVKHEYGIDIKNYLPDGNFSAIILAVAHKEFLDLDIFTLANGGVVFDVKGILPRGIIDSRL